MFRLEQINENVPRYDNHNLAFTVTGNNMGNCNIQHFFLHPNGLTDLTEILDLYFWCYDPSNETEN